MEPILVINFLLVWVVLAFNILLTLGLARRISDRFPKVETLAIGERAPEFRVKTLDGKVVNFSSFDSKPVAFLFLAPSCEPCREEMSHLRPLMITANQSGVELVMVSDDDEEKTLRFVEEFKVDLTTLVAPRNTTSFLDDYKVSISPSYYLIDEQRKVRSVGPSLRSLEQDIRSLFGGGGGTAELGQEISLENPFVRNLKER